jgi:hypothetical protein
VKRAVTTRRRARPQRKDCSKDIEGNDPSNRRERIKRLIQKHAVFSDLSEPLGVLRILTLR